MKTSPSSQLARSARQVECRPSTTTTLWDGSSFARTERSERSSPPRRKLTDGLTAASRITHAWGAAIAALLCLTSACQPRESARPGQAGAVVSGHAQLAFREDSAVGMPPGVSVLLDRHCVACLAAAPQIAEGLNAVVDQGLEAAVIANLKRDVPAATLRGLDGRVSVRGDSLLFIRLLAEANNVTPSLLLNDAGTPRLLGMGTSQVLAILDSLASTAPTFSQVPPITLPQP